MKKINVFSQNGSRELSKDNVLDLLDQINTELGHEGLFASISLYGGVAMMFTVRESRRSIDIDVMVSGIEISKFMSIIEVVAKRNRLSRDFLNQDVAVILMEDFKKNEVFLYKELSNLIIRVGSPRQILAMKLFSARLEGRDLNDCVILCKELGITSRSELVDLLKLYVSGDAIKRQNRFPNRHNCIYNFIDFLVEGLKQGGV